MASKKNSHANEEPVGWVTIKGVHFPKWKDGTIGWEQGQANVNDKGTMSTEELNKAEIRRDELWDKEDKHKITKAEKKELDNLQRSISEHYAAKRKYESKKVKEVSKEVKSSKNAKYDTSRATKITKADADRARKAFDAAHKPGIDKFEQTSKSYGEKIKDISKLSDTQLKSLYSKLDNHKGAVKDTYGLTGDSAVVNHASYKQLSKMQDKLDKELDKRGYYFAFGRYLKKSKKS